MLFSIGSKVTIKKDLEERSGYYMLVDRHGVYERDYMAYNNVNNEMIDFAGEEATIVDVGYGGQYKIDLDDEEWSWTDEMFDIDFPEDDVDLPEKIDGLSSLI